MAHVVALNAANITRIGIIIIVALVVVGALLSIVITALVGRIVILVVVLALGAYVWQQRTHIRDDINSHACNLHSTFFGIHLDAPASVVQACRHHV